MSVNWGVIGAGGIADRRTIPEGIVPADNSKLVAVMDVKSDIVERVARKYNVGKFYTKEEDLVKDGNVEAVYIASPNYLHRKHVEMAAKAGKHVLCEKPLALNVEDCRKIVRICRRIRIKLMVGFMMRFHSCHQKARELIAEGMIGQPVMSRAQLTCWYPPIEDAWRQDPKLGGGGTLIDMGIHCIDLLRMFFGEVSHVTAFTNTITHAYPVEDTATTILRFRSGAHGIVDNYFNIPDAAAQNFLELYGTKGCILAKGTIGQSSSGKLTLYTSEAAKGYEAAQTRAQTGMRIEDIEPPVQNIYRAEIEHFADCILKDLEPINSGEEATKNQQVVCAAYESAKTGRVVHLRRSSG